MRIRFKEAFLIDRSERSCNIAKSWKLKYFYPHFGTKTLVYDRFCKHANYSFFFLKTTGKRVPFLMEKYVVVLDFIEKRENYALLLDLVCFDYICQNCVVR